MKTITLQLDSDTIERLESIGDGRVSSLGAEILGFALLEAYQQKKLDEKHEAPKIPVHQIPAVAPRTYVELNAFAREHAVCVEKRGHAYYYWRKDDHGTEGESRTIESAYWDIVQNFI